MRGRKTNAGHHLVFMSFLGKGTSRNEDDIMGPEGGITRACQRLRAC